MICSSVFFTLSLDKHLSSVRGSFFLLLELFFFFFPWVGDSACIGRAIKLVLQNVGGAKLGGTESTTLGTPMKFGLCIAEWEERTYFLFWFWLYPNDIDDDDDDEAVGGMADGVLFYFLKTRDVNCSSWSDFFVPLITSNGVGMFCS